MRFYPLGYGTRTVFFLFFVFCFDIVGSLGTVSSNLIGYFPPALSHFLTHKYCSVLTTDLVIHLQIPRALCEALFFPILSPVNFSHFGLFDAQLLLFNLGTMLAPPKFFIPVPHFGNFL